MKKLLTPLFLLIISLSCNKPKINTCEYDICDTRRKTIMIATNWSGPLGYYNDLRKWAVNVPIPNTIDGFRTCILCIDIPDSLKMVGKIVTFSGDLKESCNNPKPEFGGQEIYYVNAINIR